MTEATCEEPPVAVSGAEYALSFSHAAGEDARALVQAKLRAAGFLALMDQFQEEHILRVRAPFSILAQEAEKTFLIKEYKMADENTVEKMPFSYERLSGFVGGSRKDNLDHFFTPAEKINLLRLAIQDVQVSTSEFSAGASGGIRLDKRVAKRKSAGLLSLCQHTVPPLVEEFYPLHDIAARDQLWSAVKHSVLLTPVQHIRQYFGEEVAFYFGWMNFFSVTLLLPGLLGLTLYLTRPKGMDVDHSWKLPIFAIVVVTWAVLFIIFWRRKQSSLACKWNTSDVERVAEVRPEFFGTVRRSPVTDLEEVYYPSYKRMGRYCVSCIATVPMLLVAVFFMCISLNLNGYIKDHHSPLYVATLCRFAEPGGIFAQDNPYYGWIVPTLLHSIVIFVLNSIYRHVATWCTDFENHRTTSQWNKSFITKRFLFEAFDCYIPLFYIAFYRLDINSLRSELIGLFWGDEMRRLVTEIFLPLGASNIKRRRVELELEEASKKSDQPRSDIYRDAILDEYEQFDDYLEMVIQFGYITLFASAMPLCSIISLVFLYIETKADSMKLLFCYKRPHSVRVSDIGVWVGVMEAMTTVSILSNVMLIGFSSEQLETWFPQLYELRENDHFIREGSGRYVVAIVFILEHVLLIVSALARQLVSTQSEQVSNALLRMSHRQAIVLRSHQWNSKHHSISQDDSNSTE